MVLQWSFLYDLGRVRLRMYQSSLHNIRVRCNHSLLIFASDLYEFAHFYLFWCAKNENKSKIWSISAKGIDDRTNFTLRLMLCIYGAKVVFFHASIQKYYNEKVKIEIAIREKHLVVILAANFCTNLISLVLLPDKKTSTVIIN